MRGVKAGEVWMIDFGMAAKVRFNRRHKLSGHLFAGRYKSLLIDGAARAAALQRNRIMESQQPSHLAKFWR